MSEPVIHFSNPGSLDPRSITTMGVNVKETSSPIGYFGTGLKYAIAVLLREQQGVEISSGLERMEFFSKEEQIRGKSFQTIFMLHDGEPVRLGITTELGKNWTLENAYRELYCNALDEGGAEATGSQSPAEGRVVVNVTGEKFARVHEHRGEFLLLPERKPIFSLPGVGEIYAGASEQVFYKRIGVGAVIKGERSKYTYNLECPLVLTEDRTIKSDWDARQHMAKLLAQCTDEHVVEQSIWDKFGLERYFFFSWASCSDTFYDVTGKLMQTRLDDMNQEAVTAYIKARGRKKPVRRELELTETEARELAAGVKFWTRAGFEISEYPIKLVHALSTQENTKVFAQADEGTIWLTPECFGDRRLLRLALVEEFIHLKHGVSDETRDMQNVLFGQLARLAEGLQS